MWGITLFPLTFRRASRGQKNARPRAHLSVFGSALSLVLLVLLVLLVSLVPVWLPVLPVSLRACTGFVLARCHVKFTGGCSSTFATAQTIDFGNGCCPADARPDLW